MRSDGTANAELSDVLPLRRLLIGACGSIGVVHLPTVIVHLLAVLPRLEIDVVLTRQAADFLPPSTLAVLTRREVLTDWHDARPGAVPQTDLADWAELVLVMPATGNVIAKAAHGVADDLLTTCILAADCPTVFVPSMNARMWHKPVVQRNVATLREDGARVLDPSDGIQAATGNTALGSLPPLRPLLEAMVDVMQSAAETE